MSDAAAKIIRSPSYPAMSLRDAIDSIEKIESRYRSSPVDRELAAKLIGYSSLSGPAAKALAALASYGLLERAGKGEARVTARARAILHASNDQERVDNLLAAASEPDLFRELRERFADIPIPPEAGVISHLNRQGFNPSAVRPAAKAFLQTMEYIEELRDNEDQRGGAIKGPDLTALDSVSDTKLGGAKVGDFVQWESQGVCQFTSPRRVRMVSADGQWLAVDGSETGVPMNQVIVTELAESSAPPRFPLVSDSAETPRVAIGETEWMRNKVGRETNVRLLVSGEMGPKEIGNLIKLLEAQRDVLSDE